MGFRFAVNTRGTCSKNRFPARVNRVLRVARAKSFTPNSSSSSLIARDNGDCSMCRRSAARAKWSSSATAMKQRRWRSSMLPRVRVQRLVEGVVCNQPFSRRPPSTMISEPAVHRDSSEARYSTALATSSGVPKRPNGMLAAMSLLS